MYAQKNRLIYTLLICLSMQNVDRIILKWVVVDDDDDDDEGRINFILALSPKTARTRNNKPKQ